MGRRRHVVPNPHGSYQLSVEKMGDMRMAACLSVTHAETRTGCGFQGYNAEMQCWQGFQGIDQERDSIDMKVWIPESRVCIGFQRFSTGCRFDFGDSKKRLNLLPQ